MQIDIGFGDVMAPGPTEVTYPTLLDFPAPVLQAYPKGTVIAEKLEALANLGLLNSRMKDYYDLALLARMCSFEADPARATQWRAFLRRSRFPEEPGDLEKLVAEVRRFSFPLLAAAANEKPFKAHSPVGGPWD